MTPAVVAAREAGLDIRVIEFEAGADAQRYGLAAAAALGQDPERVLKTLVVRLASGAFAVAIVPVECRLDLKAFAAASGVKRADLAAPVDAERATGYVVGGISPLGQRRRLPTVIDASAETWPSVFVSGGRRGLEIEIAPEALAKALDARFAAIARAG